MASVCCTATVPPRGSQTMTFALAWHAPRFDDGGRALGNGYCNRFTSSRDAALRTLNHAAYFTGAVRAWQKRLLDSTLPRWMPRGAVWQTTLIGRQEIWPVHRKTAELGGMLRSGLEDSFYLPDGEMAKSNGAVSRSPNRPHVISSAPTI